MCAPTIHFFLFCWILPCLIMRIYTILGPLHNQPALPFWVFFLDRAQFLKISDDLQEVHYIHTVSTVAGWHPVDRDTENRNYVKLRETNRVLSSSYKAYSN